MTSCGLNGGPLVAEGEYPAAICCNLTNGRMPHQSTDPLTEELPHITHREKERFISEISNGTMIGYKYFNFEKDTCLTLRVRSHGDGCFRIRTEVEEIGCVKIPATADWADISVGLTCRGTHALYLFYEGAGTADLLSLRFD